MADSTSIEFLKYFLQLYLFVLLLCVELLPFTPGAVPNISTKYRCLLYTIKLLFVSILHTNAAYDLKLHPFVIVDHYYLLKFWNLRIPKDT